LERDWESQQTKKKRKMEDSLVGFGDEYVEKKEETVEEEEDDDNKYAIDSDEEDLPFACFICREDFTNPIVTVCGHYFCQQCAMNSAKSSGNKCAICNKQTFGVFNRADKLFKKIAVKKGIIETDKESASKGTAKVIPPPIRKGNWETVEN
jgi:RING finger protein 113A